ncbi:MAG: immunity 17 family protein [Prevotellaceae bacterium]|jgi:small neutral amino acid transporter SnatA (MarC family)|nr:immunity 17 family protein [Prevotellaceae bacterium]
MSHYLMPLIFGATGLVALLAAWLNWDWFFSARNTAFIVKTAGRKRARLFYGLLGVLLLAMSLYFVVTLRRWLG